MTSDAPFRIIFVVAFVSVVLVTLYHRIRSWASKEKLDRRQEGLLILLTLRPLGLTLWLAVIAYMVDPSLMAWASTPIPTWARCLGVGLYVLTLALLIWTLRSLGTNLTDTVVTRKNHTLVTHGPYRFIRHPFYVSVGLFILAVALIAANWFFVLMGGIVLSLLVLRIGVEEAHLLARFGSAYARYRERTGRFLPRWPRDQRALK